MIDLTIFDIESTTKWDNEIVCKKRSNFKNIMSYPNLSWIDKSKEWDPITTVWFDLYARE